MKTLWYSPHTMKPHQLLSKFTAHFIRVSCQMISLHFTVNLRLNGTSMDLKSQDLFRFDLYWWMNRYDVPKIVCSRSHTKANVTVRSEYGLWTDHCTESISITKKDPGSNSNLSFFEFCIDGPMVHHKIVDTLNGHWNLTYNKSSTHPGGRFWMTIKGVVWLVKYITDLWSISSFY